MTDETTFDIYAIGMYYASVCTNLPPEQATARLSDGPCDGGWRLSEEAFRTGEPNGSPCNMGRTDCRHYLFESWLEEASHD